MNIFFDLDGTLFQTALCSIHAIDQLRSELGLMPLSADQIICHIGKNTNDFLTALFPEKPLLDDQKERYRFLEQTEVRTNGTLFPDAKELLADLKAQGHTLYICSTGSPEYIKLVLETTNILSYFTDLFSTKHCSSKKQFIKELLASSESFNRQPSIFIGDTSSDIQAGLANHLPTIAACYGYDPQGLSDATFFAHNLKEVSYAINKCALFYQLYAKITQKAGKIIGINGVDTSGKTMLTHEFSRFLCALGVKNQIIHIDDFHNPSSIRSQGENEIDAYLKNAFDYPKLIQEVLDPITTDAYFDKTITCLNLDTDKYEVPVTLSITPDTIVLIEGVLLFRPPLDHYFDMKIFIDISFEEVLRRARQRDVPKYGEAFLQKYDKKYIPVQKYYLNKFQPQAICDIVIDNEDYHHPKLMQRSNSF